VKPRSQHNLKAAEQQILAGVALGICQTWDMSFHHSINDDIFWH
jgi:hypothetical protein